MCDLGERPGQRRHPHHREGHPGLRVEDEDDVIGKSYRTHAINTPCKSKVPWRMTGVHTTNQADRSMLGQSRQCVGQKD